MHIHIYLKRFLLHLVLKFVILSESIFSNSFEVFILFEVFVLFEFCTFSFVVYT